MTIRTFSLTVAAVVLAGCATADSDRLRVGDIHFPTRAVDNLDDSKLKTIRGDLVQLDNCLYLTKVQGRPADKRFVVTWPSNARIEQNLSAMNKFEVVSMGAEFNKNTRSVATIPSRIEVLGRVINEPFDSTNARLKANVKRDCKGSGYVQVRTWKVIGKATSESMM